LALSLNTKRNFQKGGWNTEFQFKKWCINFHSFLLIRICPFGIAGYKGIYKGKRSNKWHFWFISFLGFQLLMVIKKMIDKGDKRKGGKKETDKF